MSTGTSTSTDSSAGIFSSASKVAYFRDFGFSFRLNKKYQKKYLNKVRVREVCWNLIKFTKNPATLEKIFLFENNWKYSVFQFSMALERNSLRTFKALWNLTKKIFPKFESFINLTLTNSIEVNVKLHIIMYMCYVMVWWYVL
jgi:hypothetical protein